MKLWSEVFLVLLVGFMSCWCFSFYEVRELKNLKVHYETKYWETKELLLKTQQQRDEANSFVKAYHYLYNKEKALNVHLVSMSAYTASVDECNEDIAHTASMTTPTPGRTVAVSRDLLHLMGRKIFIEGVGVRIVEDTMAPRWNNKIDLLVSKKAQAKEIGVRKEVRIVPID